MKPIRVRRQRIMAPSPPGFGEESGASLEEWEKWVKARRSGRSRLSVRGPSWHEHDLPRQRAGLVQGVLFEKSMCRGRFGELERLADRHAQLLFRQPAIDVVGADALLRRRGVEHGEAEQAQVLDVE